MSSEFPSAPNEAPHRNRNDDRYIGFDRDGRPVILRHETSSEGFVTEGWEEVVSYAPDRVEVNHGAGRVTTTFDASGRAVKTVYVDLHGSQDTETYTYDDAGRLVGIEEAAALHTTAEAGRGYGWPTGLPSGSCVTKDFSACQSS